MRRVYEVTVGSSKEIATNEFLVYQPSAEAASAAALKAYRKAPGLDGAARVTSVVELGELNDQ